MGKRGRGREFWGRKIGVGKNIIGLGKNIIGVGMNIKLHGTLYVPVPAAARRGPWRPAPPPSTEPRRSWNP